MFFNLRKKQNFNHYILIILQDIILNKDEIKIITYLATAKTAAFFLNKKIKCANEYKYNERKKNLIAISIKNI